MPDKQYGFYFDTKKCNGCKACHIACKDKFDAAVDVKPRRVYEYSGGTFVEGANNTVTCNVFTYYMSVGCNHCSEPVCTKACPTGAMHKRNSDGFVKVEESLCIGCGSCARACPYDAPQLDNDRKVMVKCDGCYERVAQGLKPLCVAGCTQRALDFGLIEELRQKYGTERDIAPLPPSNITNPNIIIGTADFTRPSGSTDGAITNPTEV
ncbi:MULTISPECIES: DMSO/selenate family reductase complex B subunit [Shewanella]|jgi:anaerobic dimethyl sulfoxide reductase subunit B (iron-sulfur subunit)|uniref:DMSO/selenate family reductase complex B subunit n=1 Tax=Shewanella TaxID=22 RepID=UPI001678841E|nr:DMSO/selenate family reductase complex B subunit [Shewanella fodinae]MCL2906117.1 dimethylsulfoxide reductase subunit B [Shewanella fodinae]GGY98575.1 dimethylsulfoxide reductase, chain B [Shewanella fodinae]